MAFTEKDWRNATTHEGGGDTSTPISAAALEDLETRLSDYTDLQTPEIFGVAAPTGVEATDTAAIRATVTACAAAGGGVVQLQPGTYLVDTVDNPEVAGYYAAIHLPGGVSLRGAGMYATTIQLDANSANHASASIIQNLNPDAAPADEGIVISDLTVDGDGANQTNYVWGLMLVRVRDCHYLRVRVKDVFGDSDSPPGETFHHYFSLAGDCTARDCIAEGTAGTQGSGIGCAGSTNVIWSGCRVRGMSHGFGFAEYQSSGILRDNCIAQNCAAGGFNAESSNVRSVNCLAGGYAAVNASTPYPYTTGEELAGGMNYGFVVNGSQDQHSNCEASDGCDYGVAVTAALGASSLVAEAGRYDGANTGIHFFHDSAAKASLIGRSNVMGTTATNTFSVPKAGGFGGLSDADMGASPSVPASGAGTASYYPFPAMVYVAGTYNFVSVDSANLGAGGSYLVRPGGTVSVNYGGAAPTWTWTRSS